MVELSCSLVELVKVKVWDCLLTHGDNSNVVFSQSDDRPWLVAFDIVTTDIDELLF
jgi:hypothetical protein